MGVHRALFGGALLIMALGCVESQSLSVERLELPKALAVCLPGIRSSLKASITNNIQTCLYVGEATDCPLGVPLDSSCPAGSTRCKDLQNWTTGLDCDPSLKSIEPRARLPARLEVLHAENCPETSDRSCEASSFVAGGRDCFVGFDFAYDVEPDGALFPREEERVEMNFSALYAEEDRSGDYLTTICPGLRRRESGARVEVTLSLMGVGMGGVRSSPVAVLSCDKRTSAASECGYEPARGRSITLSMTAVSKAGAWDGCSVTSTSSRCVLDLETDPRLESGEALVVKATF